MTKNVMHGYSRSHPRLCHIWYLMRRRCGNPAALDHLHYGARGISVCDDWMNLANFVDWSISNGYESNLTIDRVDTNGNYEPSNCRWTTIKVQERNRRNNDVIEFEGQRFCLAEWAERKGMSQPALWNRIYKMKWPLEKAMNAPIRPRTSR